MVAYLLELVGALVNVPSWLLDLSPFHHISPVPAAPANGVAAFVMVGLGVAGAAAGIVCLARRDPWARDRVLCTFGQWVKCAARRRTRRA